MVVLLSTMMESLVQAEVSPLQVEKSESVSASLALVIEAWRLLCLAKVNFHFFGTTQGDIIIFVKCFY